VGANGNECALRLRGVTPPNFGSAGGFTVDRPLISHLFAVGGTVGLSANRMSEEVGTTYFSLLTLADVMNVTAYKQSTDLVFAFKKESISEDGDDRFMFRQHNQVLFRRKTPTDGTIESGPLFSYLLRFYNLFGRR